LSSDIFTIGYGGYEIDQFVEALQDLGVERLIDVRELPISRKQGFAKSALRDSLKEAGIEYTHFRVLGSPKHLRHKLRETRNYDEFFAGVRGHLGLPEAAEAIRSVIDLASTTTCCMMCYCPFWQKCHRSSVVQAISHAAEFRFKHVQRDKGGLAIDTWQSSPRIRRAA